MYFKSSFKIISLNFSANDFKVRQKIKIVKKNRKILVTCLTSVHRQTPENFAKATRDYWAKYTDPQNRG